MQAFEVLHGLWGAGRRCTFFRRATKLQSKVENKPPHTAKLPPIFGASLRMDCKASAAASTVRVASLLALCCRSCKQFDACCSCTPQESEQLHCGNDPRMWMNKAVRAADPPRRCLGLARGRGGGDATWQQLKVEQMPNKLQHLHAAEKARAAGRVFDAFNHVPYAAAASTHSINRVAGGDGDMHEGVGSESWVDSGDEHHSGTH